MPITEVTLMRICGNCNQVIETFTGKKDNLQMFSDATVWCDNCQSDQPEHLDIAGRKDAIKMEQDSYPANLPIILPRNLDIIFERDSLFLNRPWIIQLIVSN